MGGGKMRITKPFLKAARSTIEKKLKEAANELGIDVNTIGNIHFSETAFHFKVEFVSDKQAADERKEANQNELLQLMGFEINKPAILKRGNKKVIVRGCTPRGKIIFVFEGDDKRYVINSDGLSKL